ncbi:MAG TPA: HAD family phosphatase [Anaerolineales bacterium]|nr:HAD family phosphatase [Anaerolineales bacterium]
MTIKAIIFDLGGVLLRTEDFTPREHLAEGMGMDRHKLEELIFGGVSGEKAQRGEITTEQHWANVSNVLGYTRQELKIMLDEFFYTDKLDDELVDYIRTLHKTYKTALLSNSADDLRRRIADEWHFEDAFDTMIISAEVGVAKPDPKIFQLALDRLGVKASEAIFVDDFQRNINSANETGIHGIRYQNTEQVRMDIARLLDADRVGR